MHSSCTLLCLYVHCTTWAHSILLINCYWSYILWWRSTRNPRQPPSSRWESVNRWLSIPVQTDWEITPFICRIIVHCFGNVYNGSGGRLADKLKDQIMYHRVGAKKSRIWLAPWCQLGESLHSKEFPDGYSGRRSILLLQQDGEKQCLLNVEYGKTSSVASWECTIVDCSPVIRNWWFTSNYRAE